MDENYLKGEIRAALERIQVNCKLWVTKELCLEFDKYAVELAKVMLAQAYNPYNPYNPPTPLLDKARADQAEFAERQKQANEAQAHVARWFCQTCDDEIPEGGLHKGNRYDKGFKTVHCLIGWDPVLPNFEETYAHNTRTGHVHKVAELCDDCQKDVEPKPKKRGYEFL